MGLVLENVLVEQLTLVVVLLLLFYYFTTSTFNFWKERGVAFAKPLPFFGNLVESFFLRKTQSTILAEIYKDEEFKNEKLVGAFIGRSPVIVLRDLELIKQVLVKDFQYFSDRGQTIKEHEEPLSAHLFRLGGWKWKALRTKLTPTFTSGKMKMMYNLMADCADGLLSLLEKPASNGESIEMRELLARFTTDVIGTCAFGLQLNAVENENSEFRTMGRKMFAPTKLVQLKTFLFSVFPILTKFLRVQVLPKDAEQFILKVVNDMIKYRTDNNYTRNDFMQLLIDIKNKGAVQDQEIKPATEAETTEHLEMTNELIAAQVFVFFVAGFETSSTTMSFALHELAQHQDIQDKLAKEVQDALNKNGGKLTYDAVQEMKYLDMVVSETLRKFSPAGVLFRKCTKPIKLGDMRGTIDGRVRVFVPVMGLHWDPDLYPNPERFDPERFTPEEKAKRHPMAYLPFGDGPKNCIGARFGLLQSKLGLAKLLNKYKFEVCEKTVLPTQIDPMMIVTSLKGGCWVKISQR